MLFQPKTKKINYFLTNIYISILNELNIANSCSLAVILLKLVNKTGEIP